MTTSNTTNAQITMQAKLAALKAAKDLVPDPTKLDIPVVKHSDNIGEIPAHIANAAAQPEKLYNVFYHTIKSCRTVTETGRSICFVGGKYITDVKEEIEYLQKEIARHNLHISIKPGEEQLTSDQLDPMKVLKKKHIEEYIAEQAELAKKKAAGTLSESSSDSQKLVPGSTSDVSDLASGSDSVAS